MVQRKSPLRAMWSSSFPAVCHNNNLILGGALGGVPFFMYRDSKKKEPPIGINFHSLKLFCCVVLFPSPIAAERERWLAEVCIRGAHQPRWSLFHFYPLFSKEFNCVWCIYDNSRRFYLRYASCNATRRPCYTPMQSIMPRMSVYESVWVKLLVKK